METETFFERFEGQVKTVAAKDALRHLDDLAREYTWAKRVHDGTIKHLSVRGIRERAAELVARTVCLASGGDVHA